jgi:RNA polymerase sigma-70 factor (ECF subfamily)
MAVIKQQGSDEAAAGVPGPKATDAQKLAWVERQGAPLDEQGGLVLRAVFPAVMGAYYDRVRRRILKWGVDPHQAEDILQDVFMELFDRVKRCGVQPNLRGLIGRITKGNLLHHARDLRDTPESVVLPSSGSMLPESAVDLERAVDYRALARVLLHLLSPMRRRVVDLCILSDKTDEEAALVLGLKEGTLKSMLAAARRELLEHARRRLPKSQRKT